MAEQQRDGNSQRAPADLVSGAVFGENSVEEPGKDGADERHLDAADICVSIQ